MSIIPVSVEIIKLFAELPLPLPFIWLKLELLLTAANKLESCCCWANKMLFVELCWFKRRAAAATELLLSEVVGVTTNVPVDEPWERGEVPVRFVTDKVWSLKLFS